MKGRATLANRGVRALEHSLVTTLRAVLPRSRVVPHVISYPKTYFEKMLITCKPAATFFGLPLFLFGMR